MCSTGTAHGHSQASVQALAGSYAPYRTCLIRSSRLFTASISFRHSSICATCTLTCSVSKCILRVSEPGTCTIACGERMHDLKALPALRVARFRDVWNNLDGGAVQLGKGGARCEDLLSVIALHALHAVVPQRFDLERLLLCVVVLCVALRVSRPAASLRGDLVDDKNGERLPCVCV